MDPFYRMMILSSGQWLVDPMGLFDLARLEVVSGNPRPVDRVSPTAHTEEPPSSASWRAFSRPISL